MASIAALANKALALSELCHILVRDRFLLFYLGILYGTEN